MKRLHVIGRKNHGKTTLVTELVRAFKSQGYRVGTIKHTHHRHELDTPGKDSHRHREAGADAVGIISPALNAVFWAPDEDEPADYDAFAPVLAKCDLVIVEGDTRADAPKIEVWRSGLDTTPMANDSVGIQAVVSDDSPVVTVPVFSRSDLAELTVWIISTLQLSHRDVR